MDLDRALVEDLGRAPGRVVDVFPRLELDLVEVERRHPLRERARGGRAGRAPGASGCRCAAAASGWRRRTYSTCSRAIASDEIGGSEIGGGELATAVPVGLGAQGDDGVARAPAHGHALDHVRAARGDDDRGDVLGEDGARHHRPRCVARAQRDQVGHRAESRDHASGATGRGHTAVMSVDVRPAATRFHTELDWLDSWHSFSFGPHHDPGTPATDS